MGVLNSSWIKAVINKHRKKIKMFKIVQGKRNERILDENKINNLI